MILLRSCLGAACLWAALAVASSADTLTVAGGCFWCVEADFESVDGVREVTSGFTGGTVENPSYHDVARGGTGHYEAVKIDYDPARVSLETLLSLFFRSVDPTDAGGQFCDRGDAYRTAVFYDGEDQKRAAEAARAEAAADLKQDIVTPILPRAAFYRAEDDHQDYYKGDRLVLTRFGPRKQSSAYKLYRKGCGRNQRIYEIWGPKAAPFVK